MILLRFGGAQNGIWVKMSTALENEVNLGLYLVYNTTLPVGHACNLINLISKTSRVWHMAGAS